MADDARAGGERVSPWLFNLGIFGILIAVVLVYAFVAVRQTQEAFLAAVRDHARLTATLVERQASGALLSRQVTDDILRAFLGNAGRFLAYLDGVEPFNGDELAAYVEEAGLAGIRIDRPAGGGVEAPPRRLPAAPPGCQPGGRLEHVEGDHLALFTLPGETAGACITVGVETGELDRWQAELELDRVLAAAARVPGIRSVRILPLPADGAAAEPLLRDDPAGGVAEVRVPFRDSLLALELDAGNLSRLRRGVWRDFIAFSLVLALSGGLLSFILYRRQLGHLRRVRDLERRLSQEREEATLGRAAAAIAHEIRNPLNAMSLGLQRLQWEAPELTPEHRDLVGVVLDALRRANGSVTGLLDYARPLRLHAAPLSLSALVEDALKPYQTRFAQAGIEVRRRLGPGETPGDRDLLAQLLDNLIRNALEAQPEGGFLEIALADEPAGLLLTLRNGGCSLSPEEMASVLEPYFTTKTRGAGLGLAISRRIAAAHRGTLEARMARPGEFEVAVRLPRRFAETGPQGVSNAV